MLAENSTETPHHRSTAATILTHGWGRPMTMADVVQADAGDNATTFALKIKLVDALENNRD